MSEFQFFKKKVQAQLDTMSATGSLYVINLDKDIMWNFYLDSFPEGTNKVFRERREYDCSCCRGFVKNLGAVVAFNNGKIMTIWDVAPGGYYNAVCEAMARYVRGVFATHTIDPYISKFAQIGTERNFEMIDGFKKTWDHFSYKLESRFVSHDAQTKIGMMRDDKNVFERSLKEIDLESAETVLDLIDQGTLYRGTEHRKAVSNFIAAKKKYDSLTDKQKEYFCWTESNKLGAGARFRNTVIGTLLSDIAAGMDLDAAVRSYETKVAPTNYKRSKALVTPAMINNARKTIESLGYEESLYRRYANARDITIDNTLFADRVARKAMNSIFDELSHEMQKKAKAELGRVDEVDVDTFLNKILPKAETIDILFENKHKGNLFSLIAPVHTDAKQIFKWNNNFSWSYNGEVADAIKERVKNAGGNVDGELRCSLMWYNGDDLDISVQEPSGEIVWFRSRRSRSGGELDVDMNAGGITNSTDPVENIVWRDKAKMREGVYTLKVNNFRARSTSNVGFVAQIECQGVTYNFPYEMAVRDGQTITVAEFSYSKSHGVRLLTEGVKSAESTSDVWGISTNTFHRVSMVLNSPNFWDGQEIGNKHLFFVVDGCKNSEQARGFYNEFLKQELNEHRKVFELLSSKMKAPESDDQLSGLGFSSTVRDSVVLKIGGTFNRTIKVKF